MSRKQYLTAKEATDTLNISMGTLYSYVSRGLIRSEETEGKTRAKRYHAEDIQALKARKEQRRNPAKAAETALHFGSPVLESAITLIKDSKVYYRGHEVVTLATKYSFETVAILIWTGKLPHEIDEDEVSELFYAERSVETTFSLFQSMIPQTIHLAPVEKFQVILPLLAAQDLAGYNLLPTAVARTGAKLLQAMTMTITGVLPTAHIPQQLQHIWVPTDPDATALLNAALILCADHELNVSAFAARCVASAGSTPYAAVMAGLAALQGPKHGGDTRRIEALFCEAESDPQRALTERLKSGERIPGFGHPLYPDWDPRGQLLYEWVHTQYPDCPANQTARALVAAVDQNLGLKPNVDFGLVLATQAMRLPPGTALTLFALGRMAGWIGHVIEQYEVGHLIRPRARYTGKQPEDSGLD